MLNQLKLRSFGQLKFISFFLTISILVAAFIILFLIYDTLIAQKLLPELEKKSVVLGQTTLAPINRALQLGLIYEKLRGVDDHLDSVIKDNKEVKYIALTDTRGDILYYRGIQPSDIQHHIKQHQFREEKQFITFNNFHNTKLPIHNDGKAIGYIHLGGNLDMLHQDMRDISYDVLVVLLISLLVTFEILLFILNYRINQPIEAIRKSLSLESRGQLNNVILLPKDELGLFTRAHHKLLRKLHDLYQEVKSKYTIFEIEESDQEKIKAVKQKLVALEEKYQFNNITEVSTTPIISYIRTPLFIFAFAESLSISFLPLFSNLLYVPLFNLPREFVIALPIMFFMLVYAISQPFSGLWANITSKRRIFIIGASISTLGLFGSGFSFTVLDFLAWRMLTAVGYGMILISCQAYIIDNTAPQNRIKGMAIYISGFYSATVCGSAIGAILADGIGFRAIFFLSAILAILSAVFVSIYIKDQHFPTVVTGKLSWHNLKMALTNHQFMALVLCISIPSKIILAGVIYYVTPLYLSSIGIRSSEIGRIIMIYGFIMLALSPPLGRFADQLKKPKLFISVGSLFSALSLLLVFFVEGMGGLILIITLLGLGHSLSMTAQVAIVPSLLKEESKALGNGMIVSIYRLFDLQGFVIGPAITSLFIARYNHFIALFCLGLLATALSLLFTFITRKSTFAPA